MQVYNLIICGYFCFGFFDFMLKGKSLQDYKNLFSPKEYEKNVKIILNFSVNIGLRWKRSIALLWVSIENLKILKCHLFS